MEPHRLLLNPALHFVFSMILLLLAFLFAPSLADVLQDLENLPENGLIVLSFIDINGSTAFESELKPKSWNSSVSIKLAHVDKFTSTQPVFKIRAWPMDLQAYIETPELDPREDVVYSERRIRIETLSDWPKYSLVRAALRPFLKNRSFDQLWASSDFNSWMDALLEAAFKFKIEVENANLMGPVSEPLLSQWIEIGNVSALHAQAVAKEIPNNFFQLPAVKALERVELSKEQQSLITDDSLVGLEAYWVELGDASKISQDGLRRALKPAFEGKLETHERLRSCPDAGLRSVRVFRHIALKPSFEPDFEKIIDGFNITGRETAEGKRLANFLSSDGRHFVFEHSRENSFHTFEVIEPFDCK